jgi:hypothetical protein
MQEPRFSAGDYVEVVRIFPCDMGKEGDLSPELYDDYCTNALGLYGEVTSIEAKYKSDDSIFFVYEVIGEGLELFFHEGELDYYARPKIRSRG